MKKTVLLTGADGFLGSRLTAEFASQGWNVVGLVRNPSAKNIPPGLQDCFDYSIESGPSPEALRISADVVIHGAFQTRGTADAGAAAVNLRASRLLADRYCRAHGALFVFISSMSAHDNAVSHYGRSKREIERSLDPAQSLAIRPGFIIGPGGIFQRLARTLSSTRIAPMPYGGRLPIQTVDVTELCRAILQLADARITGLYALGEARSIPIATFYSAIAAWMGKPITLIPVPGTPILHIARLLERLGIPLPLTSENLLGLRGLIHHPVEPAMARIGWQPSVFSEILRRYDPSIVRG